LSSTSGVKQPVDERAAVAGLEQLGGSQQLLEPRRRRAQRALRRPPARRRLDGQAVVSERVLVDVQVRPDPPSRSTSSHCGETHASG
jgi:hypothetical protein